MFEILGSYLDKSIFLLIGLFFVFIYPTMVKKRVDHIDDIKTKEKEIKRIKLFRNLGIGLVIVGILEIIII